MYVYLLQSSSKKTYVGATYNVERRVRQHNGVLKGGAKYTGKWVNRGDTWTCMGYVSGFPTWRDALQFEWKWKFLTRKKKMSGTPVERRMSVLQDLMASERSTSKAIPFKDWEIPIELVLENIE